MPLFDLFFAMLWFFLFVAWIWLLISIFADIFRSEDLSGWAKALWALFVLFVPFLGVFVYIVARGKSMQERAMQKQAAQVKAQQEYIQQVAASSSSSSSPTDEIAKLAQLRDSGALTDEEFQAQKAKILA